MLDDNNQKIKENIKILIEKGNYLEGKELLEKYERIVRADDEIYSIKGIIALMEERLDDAEESFLRGKEINPESLDLKFNIAYVLRLKSNYLMSLIEYRKILRDHYYEINREEINDYIKELKGLIQRSEDEFSIYVANTEKIFFIDIDNDKKAIKVANDLAEYGIMIDIGFIKDSPLKNLQGRRNPYRKILGFRDDKDIVQYLNSYHYNVIHLFDKDNQYYPILKDKIKFLTEDIYNKSAKDVVCYYGSNIKVNKFFESEKESDIKTSNALIEDISIIIPTYNRPYYLERTLDFFNTYKRVKPKIIVLDSSNEEKWGLNTLIAKKYDNVYYHKFDSLIGFFEKLNAGLNMINTPYVSLCADDDFLTEEGLIESYKILVDKEELYTVKGRNLYFINSMGNLIEYDWFNGLTGDNGFNRIEKIVKGFVPTLMYQLFRTEKLKSMCLFIYENRNFLPNNIIFTEYLYYFTIVATGKVGRIVQDLNIRDKSVTRESQLESFPHTVLDKTFNKNYDSLKKFIKKYFHFLGEEVEDFENRMLEVFCDFLMNFLKVPKDFIRVQNFEFDMTELEKGMRKSWCWPKNL